MQSIPQSELAIDNLLLGTHRSQAETAQLTINTSISMGSAGGAQVVTCSVNKYGEIAFEPFQAVAKIYDALYHRFSELLANEPRNVVTQADKDYSCEAAAYEYLQETGQTGSFAPTYYGSPVRLILIEHLNGTTVRNSLIHNGPRGAGKHAFHYPEEYRLEVMALAMDGYVGQLHSGIDQLDLAGRNVMLVPRGASDEPASQSDTAVAYLPLPRIMLVDYNTAIVYSPTNRGKPPYMDWPRPYNPMLYFWDEPINECGGWVPHEWYSHQKLMQKWLQTRFGTEEKRKLYAPVKG